MRKKKKIKGGFRFYRTREQLFEYMKAPALQKLRWLEEMWRFNFLVGKSNPHISEIQEKFRRGEI